MHILKCCVRILPTYLQRGVIMYTEKNPITGIKDDVRKKSLKLYDLMIDNKYLDYKSFIKIVEKEFKKENVDNDIKQYIKKMKHSVSIAKAHEMVLILKYMIAKSKNDIETIRNLKEEVDKIGTATFENVEGFSSMQVPKKAIQKKEQLHEQCLEKLKTDVDTMILEKKNIDELSEEGNLVSNVKNLMAGIKKNIGIIGIDKYIEILKIQFGLQEISIEDLEQFEYAINFFIKNLETNIELYNNYDTNNPDDIKEIYNLYEKGQEKLKFEYKINPKKMKSWKLRKMNVLLAKYSELRNILNNFNGNNLNFGVLDNNALRILKNDEEFVYQFYINLINIINVYNTQVKNIYSVNDEVKNKLCDQYIKKLLPERNNK